MEFYQVVKQKAYKVADILGWKINKNYTRGVQLLNYPYAINFNKSRKMIRIKMAYHPRLHPINADYPWTRIDLPLELTPEQIAEEIRRRLLPKVKMYTDDMLETQDLIPAW